MPVTSLPALSEKILSTLWKMNASGQKSVLEQRVRAELSFTTDEFAKEVERLLAQGFLSNVTVNDVQSLSLTSLGVAILRQIEEDNLEEIE